MNKHVAVFHAEHRCRAHSSCTPVHRLVHVCHFLRCRFLANKLTQNACKINTPKIPCLGKTRKMQETTAEWKFKRSERSQNSPIRIASMFCCIHCTCAAGTHSCCSEAMHAISEKCERSLAQAYTVHVPPHRQCDAKSVLDNNDDEHRIKASSNTLELLKSLLISCKYYMRYTT